MDVNLRPRWLRWAAPFGRALLVVVVVALVAAGLVAALHISRAGHRAWYGEHGR